MSHRASTQTLKFRWFVRPQWFDGGRVWHVCHACGSISNQWVVQRSCGPINVSDGELGSIKVELCLLFQTRLTVNGGSPQWAEPTIPFGKLDSFIRITTVASAASVVVGKLCQTWMCYYALDISVIMHTYCPLFTQWGVLFRFEFVTVLTFIHAHPVFTVLTFNCMYCAVFLLVSVCLPVAYR